MSHDDIPESRDPALIEAQLLAERIRRLRHLKEALLTPGLDELFTFTAFACALSLLTEQTLDTAEALVAWHLAFITPPHPEENG